MSMPHTLFDPPVAGSSSNGDALEDRFRGAMIGSAVGDALGWPTEFLKAGGRKPSFELPLRDFVGWRKSVGGHWWGYRDDIGQGEYSDDTQLTLAVARCISPSGSFEPERFAYSEFPLWLHYERGGGRSVKAAARYLVRENGNWLRNFYKSGVVDYKRAGANGAAMRNLPISLVSHQDHGRLVRDSLYNAIISHGHPRAILGAVLSGLSVSYVLGSRDVTARHFIQFLQHQIESLDLDETGDQNISSWIDDWEGGKENGNGNGNFSTIFTQTRREAYKHISAIGKYIDRSTREYYSLVGALDPSTKGSGIATVCAALYVFLRHLDDPHEAIYDAVNQIGSDTDTIASLAGALVGAHLGKSAVPEHLYQRVQDRAYLERMASHLFFIAFSDETQDRILPDSSVQKAGREEIYLKILAWEIGLHEMFWDALSQGSPISHPALGQGVVRGKWERGVIREGYEAKLIRVEFDCGQSCIFHSRVKNDREVSVSLSRPLERAIYGRRKKTLDISEEI